MSFLLFALILILAVLIAATVFMINESRLEHIEKMHKEGYEQVTIPFNIYDDDRSELVAVSKLVWRKVAVPETTAG